MDMDTYIIVGLGNPGKEYEFTRHNVGWLVLDHIAKELDVKIKKIKFKATYGEAFVGTKKVVLLKPQTYMNASGEAVRAAADFYNVPSDRIIVISDDISMPVNKLRIRRKGSAGGHNGLKSIIRHLGTDEFPRIKVGVADRTDGRDLGDWVLGRITEKDGKGLEEKFGKIYTAVTDIINGNIEKAMADCNKSDE